MSRVCLLPQAGTTQPVRLLLPLPTSKQKVTCKNRIQFSVQFPMALNINIIMQSNLKSYGDQGTY